MAQINVGAAIGAGFGLIRRQPFSVLAWGLLPVLLQVGFFAALAPMYAAMLGQFSQASGGAPPSPPTGQFLQFEGLGQLLNLVQVLVNAVIYCAIWRAVLKPQQSSFAYLRIGAPELLFALLTIGFAIAVGLGVLVAAIPALIIGGVVGAVSQSAGLGVGVGVVMLSAVALVAAIFLGLRFAFVGPMMVLDGRFRFTESWAATKGHVGSLFLVALGIFGIMFVIEIVLVGLLAGVGFAILGSFGGLQAFGSALQQSPMDMLSKEWPVIAGLALLQVPILGCFLAIGGAPWARAYEDLQPPTHAEVFA
jgi:hypothetical protein